MKHMCCKKHACRPETCMALPEGKTCGDCKYGHACSRGEKRHHAQTACDYFPRRFRERPVRAYGIEAAVKYLVEHGYAVELTEDPAATAAQSATLIRCPFCGGEAGVAQGMGTYAECRKCGAAGPSRGNEILAAKAWNERVGRVLAAQAAEPIRCPKCGWKAGEA